MAAFKALTRSSPPTACSRIRSSSFSLTSLVHLLDSSKARVTAVSCFCSCEFLESIEAFCEESLSTCALVLVLSSSSCSCSELYASDAAVSRAFPVVSNSNGEIFQRRPTAYLCCRGRKRILEIPSNFGAFCRIGLQTRDPGGVIALHCVQPHSGLSCRDVLCMLHLPRDRVQQSRLYILYTVSKTSLQGFGSDG